MRITSFWCLPTITAILLPGLFGPTGLTAQTIPSPYRFIDGTHSVGAFVGVAQEKRGELGIGPGGGMLFGARYALELRGPVALELTSFVMPTDHVVFQPRAGEGLVALGKADMVVAGVDARLRFTLTGARTWHGFAPFLSLGGGIVGNFSTPSEAELALPLGQRVGFGPSFLGIMGSGVRWIPNERLEVRLDGALSIWKVSSPVGFTAIEEELGGIPDQEWIGVGSVVLGATYRF